MSRGAGLKALFQGQPGNTTEKLLGHGHDHGHDINFHESLLG
jgi:hypothetical protein